MAKENKDDDLIMVGDGVEDGDQPPAQRRDDDEDEPGGAPSGADADPDRAAAGDDLEDEEDRRLGGGEAEEEERLEARRQEKKTRRQRQKEARERDQRELNFLRSRNEQLERRFSSLETRVKTSESQTIDGRIRQIENALRQADSVLAKAISDSKGDEAAEATRIRDSLRDQKTQLEGYKRQQESTAARADEPDPALVENVRQWHGRNPWFRFDRGDQDSAIAGAIDDSMPREGWNPNDPRYYEELDKRIAKALPHRAKRSASRGGNGRDRDDVDDLGDPPPDDRSREQRRSAGPRFRVGGKERVLKSNEVFVSRERKEAMIEAGVWDDPKLRAKFLKRYADYDREHANDRR